MSNELSCPQIDDTLRLYALYCRGGFDFTLLFEEAILTIIPLAFLLVIAPFRIVYSFRKKRKVVRTPLLPLKMVRIDATHQPRAVSLLTPIFFPIRPPI
jgi:hypothetical protein